MKPIEKLVAPTHAMPQVLLVGQTKKAKGGRKRFPSLNPPDETARLIEDLLAATGVPYGTFIKEFLHSKGWEFVDDLRRKQSEEYAKRRPRWEKKESQEGSGPSKP